MVSTAKVYMSKLVAKFKTSKSLNLLLIHMKANSSILIRLQGNTMEITGMA